MTQRLRLLQEAFEFLPDAVFAKDLEGRYTMANAGLARIVGKPVDEVLGRRDADVLPPEVARELEAVDRRIFEGETLAFEETLDIEGEARTFLTTKAPYRSPEGDIVGLVGMARDVTERKRSEERFGSLIETAGSVILCLAPDRTILEFNPAAERLYGRARDDVVGRDYFELFLPEEARPGVAADIERVLSGETTIGFENEVVTEDGIRTLIWNVTRLLDTGSGVEGIVAVGQDITGLKRAEEALRESEERFLTMADSAPVLIWMSGPTGEPVFFSKGWLEFTGRTLGEELEVSYTWEGMHPDDLEWTQAAYSRAFGRREGTRWNTGSGASTASTAGCSIAPSRGS